MCYPERMLTLLLLACRDPEPAPLRVAHPQDERLSIAEVQALGTHNSYHVQTSSRPEWEYTHRPLDEQLGQLGVRQFELDLAWDTEEDRWLVFHVPLIDQGTTCETLRDCASTMAAWSREHPAHHPILTLLEVKDDLPDTEDEAQLRLAALEEDLLATWGEAGILTPEEVQGSSPTLNAAVAERGWPTFATTRGRSIWVLHTGGDWRGVYTEGDTTVAGRLIFPDGGGDLGLGVAAVQTMNDPWDANIATAVAQGQLVRTRCDGDTVQARDNDLTQAQAALDSGAHFVSTDFPEPHPTTGYVVEIPGGTPSRCNPLRAAEGCASTDLEDPALLAGY